MPDLHGTIKDIVAGDKFYIARRIKNVPTTDSLEKAWFTIKVRKSDSDSQAVLQKTIVPVDNGNQGFIMDTGTDGVAQLAFVLLPTETILLQEHQTYYYDVQVRTVNGLLTTPEVGTLIVTESVTLDES